MIARMFGRPAEPVSRADSWMSVSASKLRARIAQAETAVASTPIAPQSVVYGRRRVGTSVAQARYAARYANAVYASSREADAETDQVIETAARTA